MPQQSPPVKMVSTGESPPPSESVGPKVYDHWRATSLGAVTEGIEQRLMLELVGPLAGAHVLDLGCGDGLFTTAMASRGASAVGLDMDPSMLGAAAVRPVPAGGSRPQFVQGRIERLPFPDAAFDVVVTVTVFCFLRDRAAAMREAARVVRPGGRLVLGELGRWSAWAARRRVRAWLGNQLWGAARFWTAHELAVGIEQAGLKLDAIRGAVFYPPVGIAARAFARFDPWLGRRTTAGAAFIAAVGTKAASPNR
jgi:ubiquinone/menaquinone biosynthesis C-methylase UbiE